MAKPDPQVSIEYMSLTALKPAKRNPKRHNVKAISEAIRRHGFVRELLINERTGRLVAGHGRIEALSKMKDDGEPAPRRVRVEGDNWLVPVLRGISFTTEKEAEAYLLADNRVGELGGYDDAALRDVLSRVSDFAGTGFSEGFYEDLSFKLDNIREPQGDGGTDPYGDGQLRQLACLFKSDDFDSVIDRLDAVATAEGLESNTDVLLHLLAAHAA